MARLVWDGDGNRIFETGVQQGVLYVKSNSGYANGVAWNGLTSVTESPSGAEITSLYANNEKYLNLVSVEELGGTIEAYTYPEEFEECDGSAELVEGVLIGQQERKIFGLCYRTEIGNDVDGNDHGYKLHIVYGCQATPSERAYSTINDSPEAITFSWEFKTVPVDVTLHKPTSLIIIDSTKADATKLSNLEAVLYGADTFDATKTYAVGQHVIYSSGSPATSKLYRCKTAITTAAAWDSTKWDEVALSTGPRLPLPDEVKSIMTPAI